MINIFLLQSPPSCAFCNRPPADVVCNSCGYTFRGRVRQHCKKHTDTILLMDHSTCPKCFSLRLLEFGDPEPMIVEQKVQSVSTPSKVQPRLTPTKSQPTSPKLQPFKTQPQAQSYLAPTKSQPQPQKLQPFQTPPKAAHLTPTKSQPTNAVWQSFSTPPKPQLSPKLQPFLTPPKSDQTQQRFQPFPTSPKLFVELPPQPQPSPKCESTWNQPNFPLETPPQPLLKPPTSESTWNAPRFPSETKPSSQFSLETPPTLPPPNQQSEVSPMLGRGYWDERRKFLQASASSYETWD